MNDLKIFENEEFGSIRTVEIDGAPWFVGKDVAEALGYANPKNAVPDHVDVEDKLSTQIKYSGQNRTVTIINESGLYSLILSSKLPSAKKFKRWITSEVLPSLRKAAGLEAWEAFKMMDKEHQKKCMDIIHGFKEPTKVDYIKANTIADKAVSIRYGFPKMVKKPEMTAEMLIDRQKILDDTVTLMSANERFDLGMKVSKVIYEAYKEM